MAIASGGLSASNYQASASFVTVTIPAVSAGDLVVVLGLHDNVATAFTLTSTGTTPTAIATTPIFLSSSAHGAWQWIASGTDSGKVLTLTSNGASGKLAIVLASYTGVLSSAPVDQAATNDDHLLAVSTHVCASVTTVTDQDWILQGLTGKDTTTTSWTVPGTQRVIKLGTGGGSPSAILTDGNGPVSASTSQGGGSFVSGQGVTAAGFVEWTIAISPTVTGTNVNPTVAPGSGTALTAVSAAQLNMSIQGV